MCLWCGGRTLSLGGEGVGGVYSSEDAKHCSVLYICNYFVPTHTRTAAYFVQGSVAFSEETGDRMAWTKIEQLINEK